MSNDKVTAAFGGRQTQEEQSERQTPKERLQVVVVDVREGVRGELGAASSHLAPAHGLDSEVQAHLGQQLKAMYQSLVEQPIPDRLLNLLSQLEKEESGGGQD